MAAHAGGAAARDARARVARAGQFGPREQRALAVDFLPRHIGGGQRRGGVTRGEYPDGAEQCGERKAHAAPSVQRNASAPGSVIARYSLITWPADAKPSMR